MSQTSIVCASCNNTVPNEPQCASCGEDPRLMGRFVFEKALGAGTFGTTYLATRIDDGSRVAIKEMLVRRADSLKTIELFEREAAILKRLDHPGIPKYFEDFAHEAGRNTAFYLVQEYIQGECLSDRLKAPFPEEEVFRILEDIFEILVYLQGFSPPVVHRDIKPANLIRAHDGRLMLIDFGSVRAALDTTTGGSTVAGTFGYMAPEQFMGRALPQTDVYGAAACVIALLSGQDAQQLMDEDRTLDLSRLRLSSHRLQLLKKFLAPRAEDRPDARHALELLRTGVLKKSTPENTGDPLPRKVPKDFVAHYLPYNRNYRWIAKMLLLQPGIVGMFYVIGHMQGLDFSGSSPFYATFGAVFGLAGLIVWNMAKKRASDALEAWQYGQHAHATIESIDLKGPTKAGVKIFAIRYSFSVNGQKYTSTHDIYGDHNLIEGAIVPVFYLPQDPRKNIFLYALPETLRPSSSEKILSFAEEEAQASVSAS